MSWASQPVCLSVCLSVARDEGVTGAWVIMETRNCEGATINPLLDRYIGSYTAPRRLNKYRANRVLNRTSHQHSATAGREGGGGNRFTINKIAIAFTSSYVMNNTHRPYLMSPIDCSDHKVSLFASRAGVGFPHGRLLAALHKKRPPHLCCCCIVGNGTIWLMAH